MNYLDPALFPQSVGLRRRVQATVMGNTKSSWEPPEGTDPPALACSIQSARPEVVQQYAARTIRVTSAAYFREDPGARQGDVLVGLGPDAGRRFEVRAVVRQATADTTKWVAHCDEVYG